MKTYLLLDDDKSKRLGQNPNSTLGNVREAHDMSSFKPLVGKTSFQMGVLHFFSAGANVVSMFPRLGEKKNAEEGW